MCCIPVTAHRSAHTAVAVEVLELDKGFALTRPLLGLSSPTISLNSESLQPQARRVPEAARHHSKSTEDVRTDFSCFTRPPLLERGGGFKAARLSILCVATMGVNATGEGRCRGRPCVVRGTAMCRSAAYSIPWGARAGGRAVHMDGASGAPGEGGWEVRDWTTGWEWGVRGDDGLSELMAGGAAGGRGGREGEGAGRRNESRGGAIKNRKEQM